MSEERLKEIKDSIGLQASVMQIKHLDTTIIDEEISVYISPKGYGKSYYELQQRIDKAIEYINKGSYFDGSLMCKSDLINILRGKDK